MVKKNLDRKRKHKIVISDDDKIFTSSYYRALELEGYDIEFYDSVDDVVSRIAKKGASSIELFVIDILQPPGNSFKDKPTEAGRFTGLYLANHVRQKLPKVPIILFSVASFPDVRKNAENLAKSLDECILLKKSEILPSDLVRIVNKYFEELSLSTAQEKGFFKKLFKSLILQPNFVGIGIDLKEFTEDE